ncbi:MAG: DUF2007 domain-containing protein [Bacteroidales bacterium]|nr:DUF2007 domain-containing protein [Bacteroidales bacterium]
MEDNWQKIYSSSFEHKLELVKAVLEDEGINSVIINKKDSAYLFGELELYVHADDVLKSKQIINKEAL